MKKTLLLVMGSPGSGKTTLSKSIISKDRFVYLDNNFIADSISLDRSDDFYNNNKHIVYNSIYRIAKENLDVGNNVLLDIPHVTHMQKAAWRDEIQNLSFNSGALLKIIRCYCNERNLLERITRRGEPRDMPKLKDWAAFMAAEPIRGEIPINHIEICTDLPMSDQLSIALDYLEVNL